MATNDSIAEALQRQKNAEDEVALLRVNIMKDMLGAEHLTEEQVSDAMETMGFVAETKTEYDPERDIVIEQRCFKEIDFVEYEAGFLNKLVEKHALQHSHWTDNRVSVSCSRSATREDRVAHFEKMTNRTLGGFAFTRLLWRDDDRAISNGTFVSTEKCCMAVRVIGAPSDDDESMIRAFCTENGYDEYHKVADKDRTFVVHKSDAYKWNKVSQ